MSRIDPPYRPGHDTDLDLVEMCIEDVETVRWELEFKQAADDIKVDRHRLLGVLRMLRGLSRRKTIRETGRSVRVAS